MQFPFLLAVLAALVIAENCPPGPADGVLWRSELTALAIAVVVVAAQAISSVTAVRIRRRPEASDQILSICGRWRRMHTALWIGMVTVISLVIGWPQIVRFNWGLDGTFLLDEILILLPVLIPLVLSWIAFYQIERATYAARVAAGSPRTRPAPSLKHFLSLHARHYLGVMLVPILLLIAAQDAVALWMPGALRSGWSTLVYAVPVALMVVFFPTLLRRLWKTRPLAAGELRERLTALSTRAGLPVREILIWETRGVVVNAAVSGWIPGHRYVFLTDALIDRLTSQQIEAVFGHELGHIRRRHLLLRGLVMLAPLSMLLALETAWPESAAALNTVTTQLQSTAHLPLAIGVLITLASYAYFVFGGYCRLLEREADLYGCRMLETETPEEAHQVFCSALERLAIESGVPREKSTWQHPSIARRTAFLTKASEEPERLQRFERRVRWLNWLLAACVLVPAAMAVVL
jgi:STE24 endopeptidase